MEADGWVYEATKVHCGVFKSLDGKEVIKFSPLDGVAYVAKMLDWMDSTDCLIFHNGYSYDFPLLRRLYNYEYKGQKLDTLVMSRLQNPKRPVPPNCPIKTKPHSVETWGYRVGKGKPEHNDWFVFSPAMLHRCEEDVEIQRLTYHYLEKERQGFNWEPALKLTHRLFEILQKQEDYGWLVDREWMDKSIHMLDHWMKRIDKALNSRLPMVLEIEESKTKGVLGYVKEPFKLNGEYNANITKWMVSIGLNPDNRLIGGPFSRITFRRLSLDKPSEVKDFLLDSGWEPVEWNTNDEGARTSPKLDKNDPFEGIEGGLGRLVAKYVQCKSRKAIIEGWLEVIRPDGRIPSVVANLAETGRATHRNIVNVPNGEAFFGKWMRKIFTCKKGWVLVGTDSAGCQNRMLAARVGDDFFTKTLIEGKKEEGTSIHHVNQKALKKFGFEVSYGKAKNLNYAFMFGASDKKLGKMVGGDVEQGKKVREALLSVAAGFKNLVESLVAEWRKNAKKRPNKWGKVEYYDGWVTGLDGRPIKVASEHAILVYVLQSDEAIMMSCAYCWMYKELCAKYKWGEDFGIVIFYHDEVDLECKPEIAEDVARICEECIARAGRYYKINCPHKGEASIGANWFECH